MKKLLLSLIVIATSLSARADIEKDFEGLGGNKILLDKAKAIDPGAEVSVVQDRTVSRRNRWEIAPEYSGSFGGDAYIKTMNAGLNVNYHINPKWSLGLKYNRSFSKLTPEGDAVVDRAIKDFNNHPEKPSAPVPEMDFQREEKMAFVNWYPIYGKMNLLDRGVAQFDVYALAGAGQMVLESGTVPTYSVGGGLGVWWTQNFSTRVEMRYQNYKAQYFDGEKSMDLALASVQMGWLL
jgi:outer membrane immunogenic protein